MAEISQRRNDLICLCLALATLAVYWPVRHFQFVNYDDVSYVTQNPYVRGGLTLRGVAWALTSNYKSNWHPLTWISHMLDCQFFGLDAGAHHLVNVVIHIASTLLLFLVLTRMTAAPWRSAFVAALFALHPLHVESVAWIAERKDVLSAFFWMLTLWAYLHYVENCRSGLPAAKGLPGRAREGAPTRCHSFYALTLAFFTLGLMAKPMLVTLPFVLLLLDYWPLGRTRWAKSAAGERAETSLGRLVMEKLPFLALSAASCVATVWAQRSGGAVASVEVLSFGDRMANAVVSYVWYIGKMFWPTGLAVLYPFHEWSLRTVLCAGAALLGISGLVVWRARRSPPLAVGWLWYVGTLVPVIGLMQAGGQAAADRYTYVPLIGLFMMLAWGVPRRVVEKRLPRLVTAIVAVALVGVCAVLCRAQVGYWKNSETLFRHDVEVTRANWVAFNNLALALSEAGKPQEATEYFERALRLRPEYAESHYNFGLALAGQGRLSEAIEQWQEAVRINPDYAEAEYNLGVAFQQTGMLQEAAKHFQQVVRIKPKSAEAYYSLGNAQLRIGEIQEAIDSYEQALQINPSLAEVHFNLGNALSHVDRNQDAIRHYEEALRLKPELAEARNNLARLRAPP